ncbi:thiamine pyrophosphate-binding protein [Mediterraneibacter agrestimuris]|uniref:thiamine pyrophosphate-binding protein n=1 Tax=Mediterraneibacter agrestimuris TaxID=2941333 RepID=UPI0020401FA3|nr:thiamine pyrophosphate-binding protein [Mediterraneibacter agrestimuris]
MKEMYTGGELVVKMLEEFGAKVVFGVPGGQTLYVTDPMQDTNIRFVHTRHENGAACAADGWGRLTGEPGICLATTGPGATNLITGIGGAYRDSSPVIALVFQNKLPDAGKGDAQESDHGALFQSICKRYIPVRDVSTVQWAMREAYRVAKTGRPGPVVVDLYRDVVENQKAAYIPQEVEQYCVLPKCEPADEVIDQAFRTISNSSKVCIWVGNGVKIAKAAEEVKALSSVLHAPVVTTYNGMAVIESDFPNLIGPRSRHGSRLAKRAIEEAECVILIGSSLTAISTNRWEIKAKNIVQFDIIAENIGRHYPVTVGVVGDAKQSLCKLQKQIVKERYEGNREYLESLLSEKKQWMKQLLSGKAVDKNASPVPPLALQAELQKELKENSVFVVDAGNPGAWTHITEFPRNVTYMKPVNYGNMGFALGASLGCKEACPDREVIALLGDGSLGMTLGDLETIQREKSKVIVIVVNDSAFGNIKQEELFKMGEDRYTGVDFPDIDYVDVAKAFGMEGIIVRRAAELSNAFEKARKSNGPFMIEVKLDGRYSVWPEAV